MAFYWTVLATGSSSFMIIKGKVLVKILSSAGVAYLKLIIAIPPHSQVQARGKCLLSSEMYVMCD